MTTQKEDTYRMVGGPVDGERVKYPSNAKPSTHVQTCERLQFSAWLPGMNEVPRIAIPRIAIYRLRERRPDGAGPAELFYEWVGWS